MRCEALSRLGHRLRISIDGGDVGTGRKKGGAMSAAPQCAIEYSFRAAEKQDDFVHEHRGVIGAIPHANHRCFGTHLQNRLTISSVAGVYCGIAVNICFAASG